MRDPEDVDAVNLSFQWCAGLAPPETAKKALAAILRTGAWSETLRVNPDFKPFQSIRPDGSGWLGQFGHAVLEKDSSAWWDVRRGLATTETRGVADVDVNPSCQEVTFWQGGSYHVQGDAGVDLMMSGLLAFGTLMYAELQPLFGFIDALGDNTPTGEEIGQFHLQEISWANFFGPAYVARIGRNILHAAPAWRATDLSDGGVLLVATESYIRWLYPSDQEGDRLFGSQDTWEHPLARHFRGCFPEIRAFKPFRFSIDAADYDGPE